MVDMFIKALCVGIMCAVCYNMGAKNAKGR